MSFPLQIPISEIIIGNRRREDMGDIQGLANSITKYGLLHPVVVDSDNRLVAGGRRLEACKLLGWENIPASLLGELTDKQLREIEIEENIKRKDLTAIEISRNMVELAEIKAEELREKPASQFCPPSGQNLENDLLYAARTESRIGRPPGEKPDGVRAIAKEIGVSPMALVEARQHVAAVDKYSELESIPKKQAIQVARELDQLPETSRPAAIRKITTKPDLEDKEIDRQHYVASQVQKMVFIPAGYETSNIDEAVRIYLEWTPLETADDSIERLHEGIKTLQDLIAAFERTKKLKVVK